MPQDPTAAAINADLLLVKRKELVALDTRKKSLESEAEAIVSELTAELPDGGQPMGIDTPLVDSEGYPRADIDVYRARTLRKRFHEIQTDLKDLVQRIDRGLVEVTALSKSEQSTSQSGMKNSSDHDETQARLAPKPKPKFDPITGKWVVKSWDGSVAGVENGENRSFDDLNAPPRSSATESNSASEGGSGNESSSAAISSLIANAMEGTGTGQQHPLVEEPTTPFAIIDEVFPDSPAHEAGIKEGDLLLRFGNVNSENHCDFRAIAELVPNVAGEGGSISIAVHRKEGDGSRMAIKTLNLRPRPWNGRGLLGCHISKCS